MELFGNRDIVDVMRLEVCMSYSPNISHGTAYVNWVPIVQDVNNVNNLKPLFIGLLYSRILTIQKEIQQQLFDVIDNLSKDNVRNEGNTGYIFEEWFLHIKGVPSYLSSQYIWPWTIDNSKDSLYKPKSYLATFSTNSAMGDYGISLKMGWGQERILAPSSVLITIASYCQNADPKGCYELAVYLWQINEYYKAIGKIPINHETKALKYAMNSIRDGNLIMP